MASFLLLAVAAFGAEEPRLFSAEGTCAAGFAHAKPLKVAPDVKDEWHTIPEWGSLAASLKSATSRNVAVLALVRIAKRHANKEDMQILVPDELLSLRKEAAKFLNASDARLQEHGLAMAKDVGDPSFNQYFLKFLLAPDEELQRSALYGLVLHADESCINGLFAFTRNRAGNAIPGDDRDPVVIAIATLERIGTPKATAAINELWKSAERANVKEALAVVLDRLERKQLIKPAPSAVFSSFGSFLKLPTLNTTVPTAIGSLGMRPEGPLSLALRSDVTTLPDNTRITIEPIAENRTWSVVGISGNAKIPLANISLDAQSLLFVWNKAAAIDLRPHLANCLLELTSGDQKRLMQLRQPSNPGPLTLNMAKDKQTVPFQIPFPPKPDRLMLKVHNLLDFPPGARLRKGRAEIPLNSQGVIEFGDQRGPEISVRFARPNQSGQFAIVLDPVYKAGKAEYELTLEGLERYRLGIENALARNPAEVSKARANLQNAQNSLSLLDSNRPSTQQQLQVWEPAHNSAAKDVRRCALKVEDLQNEAVFFRERLKAVPEVRAFIESMHDRAAIEYSVYAECGEQDILLVDGTIAKEVSPTNVPPAGALPEVDEAIKGRAQRAKGLGLEP